PLIKTRAAVPAIGSYGAGGNHGGNFLAIVGLEFYASTRDPNSPDFVEAAAASKQPGFFFLNPSSWILVEDCKVSFYNDNIVFQLGIAQSIALRRNVIADAYSPNSHAQGILTDNVINLLLEENVIDHNGWNDSAGAPATIFNHNIYLQGAAYAPKSVSGPAVVKGNIIARASSHGLQLRTGGEVSSNLFIRNPISIIAVPPSKISENVFLAGNDINPTLPRGFGID